MIDHSLLKDRLRKLPSVNRLIHHEKIKKVMLNVNAPHAVVVAIAQEIIDEYREKILSNELLMDKDPIIDKLVEELASRTNSLFSTKLRRVINGTGVVLNTNLGRARLSRSAIDQIIKSAAFYTNLEYVIDEGVRGSRHNHVEDLICQLTRAESAMVVNNNAAAVYLILRELAKGKEIIISRGQLVEIGGSFRMSEIMAESGAKLVEVGTTNKTHLFDYERAINEETGLLMKVHTSNFRISGFTASVSLSELVELGNKFRIPVYEDLGSGMLYDIRSDGIGDEPLVQDVFKSGVDIISFSGDKLLGGPQAGIIVGKKKWIERLKKNQLARVLRVDKMTLAGLEATFRLYLDPQQAKKEIPTLRDILASSSEIEDKAKYFISGIKNIAGIQVDLIDDVSEIGGGTLPGVTLPTKVVAIQFKKQASHHVERKLRLGTPPVIVRIVKGQLYIDFRTILWEEIDLLVEAILNVT